MGRWRDLLGGMERGEEKAREEVVQGREEVECAGRRKGGWLRGGRGC